MKETPPNEPLRLSVIMPAYNEINTIEEILTRVRRQKIEGVEIEILVVDDGSTDGTRSFLEDHPNLYDVFLKNPRNLGKGGAVKRGLETATGDYVLFQDADLEYDPGEYHELLSPVLGMGADLVMGSRFGGGRATRVLHFWHKFGNRIITTWFNILYNTTWTDVYSCYILFRRSLLDPNELRLMGWSQHAEILGKLCIQDAKMYEVPIRYDGRTYAEGKKIHMYHVLGVGLTMLRVRVLH